MKGGFVWVWIILFSFSAGTDRADFRSQQLNSPRVREAYRSCGPALRKKLAAIGLMLEGVRIYMRGFKQEMELEVWGQTDPRSKMKKIETYKICTGSGGIGPKRRQGDLQIPEGFYIIDRFNPMSLFHLSLGLNYPNPSDRFWARGEDPGGDIFIHGACVTIGCLPLTDAWIQEVYLLAVEARQGGQRSIPVHIFPLRMTPENHRRLQGTYFEKPEWLGLWDDLQVAYERFNETGLPPRIRFLANGRQRIE